MHFALKMSALALITGLASCVREPAPSTGNGAAAAAAEAVAAQPAEAEYADVRPAADANLPLIVVHKAPPCGCCETWVGHMRAAGFPVEVRNTQDLGAINAELGVPVDQGSCHTAQVGATSWRGMVQGGVPQAYDVMSVAKDGSTSVFAHHGD
jgi:hypothetical protein